MHKNKEFASNSRSRVQKTIYGEKMLKINKDLPPPPNDPYFQDYGNNSSKLNEKVDNNNLNRN